MTDPLDLYSRELLERLVTEEVRPAGTPGTHLVGGVVKACSKLETLLRATVIALAREEGVAPENLLARTSVGGSPIGSISKAMAGPLAHSLSKLSREARARQWPASVRPLLDDLGSRSSRIFAFIKLRNEVAKQGEDPAKAKRALSELRQFVETYRLTAGWAAPKGSGADCEKKIS